MERPEDEEAEVSVVETPPAEADGPSDEFARRVAEEGQRLKVKLGPTARQDEVTLEDGTPIRGVTQVTVHDNVQTGRVVTLRVRTEDVEGEFEVRAISEGTKTIKLD